MEINFKLYETESVFVGGVISLFIPISDPSHISPEQTQLKCSGRLNKFLSGPDLGFQEEGERRSLMKATQTIERVISCVGWVLFISKNYRQKELR